MSDETTIVDIQDISLEVLSEVRNDAKYYQQRGVFEEYASRLYPTIRNEKYSSFVDVGANYGLISLLVQQHNPGMRTIAIEPDSRLVPLIENNFRRNKLPAPTIINAIAGRSDAPSETFSRNPNSSLDNRVAVDSWEKQQVPRVCLDRVLSEHGVTGKTFIKIDTQGYELEVLLGAERWLSTNADWTIKMEFAPQWIVSQGTSPTELMNHLLSNYAVFECPARIPYRTQWIGELLHVQLSSDDVEGFVDHVTSLNKNGEGWVDLIVRPRVTRNTA